MGGGERGGVEGGDRLIAHTLTNAVQNMQLLFSIEPINLPRLQAMGKRDHMLIRTNVTSRAVHGYVWSCVSREWNGDIHPD